MPTTSLSHHTQAQAPAPAQADRPGLAQPSSSQGPWPHQTSGVTELGKPRSGGNGLSSTIRGVSSMDLAGLGCGSCTFGSPKLDFFYPFQEKGRVEIMTGTKGPGSGSMRLIRGNSSDPVHSDIFMVPARHIEQAIVIPGGGELESLGTEGLFRVVVVPTAAVGASAVNKKYPQIIRFQWPDREVKVDGKVRKESEKDTKMYMGAVKSTLNQQLVAFEKQVISYSEQPPAEGQSPMFKCSARLDSVKNSYVERGEGTLFFLPTGILWLGESTLYFPFNSLQKSLLVFCRDLASKTATSRCPIVAMGLLLDVSEPFYETNGDGPEPRLLHFKDIQEYDSVKEKILKYAETYRIDLQAVQQTFYNYEDNSPMTGFGFLMED
ncbi:hypothetical protein NM208_g6187 [Fusarium decemcellulare]|uniref:Uncharacterized protein n=1 Tax=Fusarium decemcellulare TaxID=57161 RepID=A0ACC1SEC6_9HYPO|nr:hypothetical protein NM208_g6187 [Fusarium decemcellulare]